MSDGWNIALLGATGAVGAALLELLAEHQFPVGELYALASGRWVFWPPAGVQHAAAGHRCGRQRVAGVPLGGSGAKVLQDDGLPIAVSTVQAPVFYGNTQIVQIENLHPVSAEEAREALQQAEDINLTDEDNFPTQVGDASGSAHLSIGCVRNDYGIAELLQFWSVADNVRFSCALMAIKTAEKLVQEYLY